MKVIKLLPPIKLAWPRHVCFIEITIQRQENEWSCPYILGLSIFASVSGIFRFNFRNSWRMVIFGTVLMEWWFLEQFWWSGDFWNSSDGVVIFGTVLTEWWVLEQFWRSGDFWDRSDGVVILEPFWRSGDFWTVLTQWWFFNSSDGVVIL